MSQTWYPIIDYDKCSGCLACYDKCTHGVFELNSRNFPKVVLPEGCVHGCKGCGSLCPEDAIEYLGDVKKSDEVGLNSSENESCCGDGAKEESGGCCGSDSIDGCCGGNDTDCGCEDEDDNSEDECCSDEKEQKTSGCGCGCC